MKYQIELPLPPRALSPNFRGHTRARAPWVRKYRAACGMLLRKAQIGPLPTPVTLHWDFYYASRKTASGQRINDNCFRARDEGNALGSVKAGIDALADAGIVPDDSKKYVRMGSVTLHSTAKEHKGRTGVVLTIETIKKEET